MAARKPAAIFLTANFGTLYLKKFGEHIAILIIGIIIAVLLAEMLVRVLLPQNRMVTWIEMHPEGFMMNTVNLEAMHHSDERKNRYRLNDFGLRGEEFNQQREKYRVLLIGDSFTFGLYLSKEHTISSHLTKFSSESYHNDSISFLNGGVGGAGMADWPGWLTVKGKQMHPDLIIYFLNTADTDRAISKNLWVLNETDSALIKSQRWKPRKFFMNLGKQTWYRQLQEKSHLMNVIVRLAWRHVYFKDLTNSFNTYNSHIVIPDPDSFYPGSGYSKSLSYKLIETMQDWCKNNQCEFILSTTGFFEEADTEPHTQVFYESLQEETLTFPFYDNTPCVKQKAGNNLNLLRISGGDHPDERGALAIAACTWQWLEPWLIENRPQE